MKNKKLLIIIGILVFIVVVIVFALTQKKATSPIISPTITPTITSINPALDEKIYFPMISGDNLIYLAGTAQELRQISLADKNQKAIVYPIDIPFVEEINWSPDKTKAIIKTNNQTTHEIKFYLYDLTKKELKPLNDAIATTAEWSDDNQILYCSIDNNLVSFNQFNLEQNKIKSSAPLKQPCDGIVAYLPNDQKAIIFNFVNDISASLYLIDLKNPQNPTLITDNFYQAKISPDKNLLLIEPNGDGETKNLLIYDLKNNTVKKFNVSTKISKLVWLNQNEIIAAVAENNTDVFYQINLETGAKKKLANQPSGTIDAQNLSISPDNKTLYFTNDDYLYQIGL